MNLVKDFNTYPPEQFSSTQLEMVVHPTRSLVLLQIPGTATMIALDAPGVQALLGALVTCYDQLKARATKES